MDGEIKNFIMVWLLIYANVCYCYTITKFIPKGTKRLITFIPVLCLFLVLPLNLHSLNLGVLTSFLISWLGNFKLFLLAFGLGPLSDPSLSMGPFFALACLPIKIQQNLPPNISTQVVKNLQHLPDGPNKVSPYPKNSKTGLKSPLNYATKALVLALLVRGYDFREYLHPKVIRFQTCIHLYINLELVMAFIAVLAQALLGLELEPQFNEPCFSTSVQDFWGKRWNLMASDILKLTIYQPIRNLSTLIVGRKWAFIPGILVTFLVSGIMHELLVYQWGRLRPTWWTTVLFIVQGSYLVVEIVLKKRFGDKWQMSPVISGLSSLTFIIFTFCRLCITDLQRFEAIDKTLEEYAAFGIFVKGLVLALTPRSFKFY